MSNHTALRHGCFVLVTLLLVTSGVSQHRLHAAVPNIVVILADDMGYGDVQTLNRTSRIPTPHLNRLAQSGVTFTDAHTPTAVCTPTRDGLLTGRYCWRSRLKSGVLNGYGTPLIEPDRPTIASFLGSHGYHTGIVGKWHLGLDFTRLPAQTPQDKNTPQSKTKRRPTNSPRLDFTKPILEGPVARGFDIYYGDDIINWGPFRWIQNDLALDLKQHPHIERQVMPTLASKSVEYINSQAKSDKPFFLYMPLTAPHAPIVPMQSTPQLESTYGYGSLKKYEQFIATVDWTVGEVLKVLDAQQIRNDTMIVFASDNGVSKNFASSDNVSPGFLDAKPLRGQKADIWEGGHRVPLLIRWPGHITANTTSDHLVSLTDLFATCADVISTDLPETGAEDSISFLGAALGRREITARPPIINHSNHGEFAYRAGDWKLVFRNSGVLNRSRGRKRIVELYNLKDDIAEESNLAASQQDVVSQLTKELDELIARGASRKASNARNDSRVRHDVTQLKRWADVN